MAANVEFDDRFVRDVIRASSGCGAGLTELSIKYGATKIARLLVEEITSRCPPPINDTAVLVELNIFDHGADLSHYLLVIKDSPVHLATKKDGFIAMRIEYELTELVRELYGPVCIRRAGVYGTKLFPYVRDDDSAAEQIGKYFLAAQQGTQTVLAGCTSGKPDLSELSARYLTPKFGSLHWFTPHYDHHFSAYRSEQVRVLEIGVGGYRHPSWGGGSLRMWKHFFPRGQIYGLDIVDKSHLDEFRIKTLQGDQGDAAYLESIAEQYGPFDIVIDDGSHINEHIRTSFRVLFPHVRPGGLYVIEDTWTAYWPGFGGNEDPQKSDGTSLGLLKSLIDAIQHEELSRDSSHSPSYVDENVVGLHVYHNIAFIEKGRNAEGGIPTWIPHDFESLAAASSGGAV